MRSLRLAFALTVSFATSPALASGPRWCDIMAMLPEEAGAVPAFKDRFERVSGCKRSAWRKDATEWFCRSESWTFTLTPDSADGVILAAEGFSRLSLEMLARCGKDRWRLASDFDPGMALFRGEFAAVRGAARIGVLGPVDYGKTILRLGFNGSPRRDWSAEYDKVYSSRPVAGVRSAVRLAGIDPTRVTEAQIRDALSAKGAKIVWRQSGKREFRFIHEQYAIDVSPPDGLADVEKIHLYFRANRLATFVYRMVDRASFERRIAELRRRYGTGKNLASAEQPSIEWNERDTGQGVMTVRAVTYGANTAEPSYSIYFINSIVGEQLEPVERYMDRISADEQAVI